MTRPCITPWMRHSITFLILFIYFIFTGCEFNKSVQKDFISGLTVTGDGLACDDASLSVESGTIQRSTFTYGEEFHVIFSDVTGFKRPDGKAFPGMMLVVTHGETDTVFRTGDLYEEHPEGFELSPLKLTADLTVADPMHSNNEYELSVIIWDKNGEGRLVARLKFSITPNEKISVNANVPYSEIYFFSRSRRRVITDNQASPGEEISLFIEGVSGFTPEQGRVFPGLSLNVVDGEGDLLMEHLDLFDKYSEQGVTEEDLKTVSAQIAFPSGHTGMAHCKVVLWDKKGPGKIELSSAMELE